MIYGRGQLYIADCSNSAVRAIDVDLATSTESGSWGRLKALYR